MAPPKLTDYERKRLENIRRNNEMMAALKLRSKATELCNFKRQSVGTKSQEVKSPKKPITEIRRSRRSRGMPPDSQALDGDTVSLGPLSMADARKSTHSDSAFVEMLAGLAQKEAQAPDSIRGKLHSSKGKMETSLRLESLCLDPENIAKVVPGRTTSVRFFPTSSVKMIVAGDKFGNMGFWNMGESEAHFYRPHQDSITGILIPPHCCSKIYTCSYDGILRLMDAEKEIFDLVFKSDKCTYAISQPTNETNCLYLAEGSGGFTIWDNRTGESLSHWSLHRMRINTIDFNSENPHIVATSSSDGTACTWDLRYTHKDKLSPLKIFTHEKGLQSAYFSPSGCSLATTSLNTTICIYSGVNLENAAVVYHDNQSTCCSTLRAEWGWDDTYLFIGNTRKGFDVVSSVEGKTVMTLESPHMSANSHKLDTHSCEVGTLAGATGGGQVYVWTSR